MSNNLVTGNKSDDQNNKIKVMVADENPLFCKRLSALIKSQNSFEYVDESTSYEDTLTRVKAFKPDILLLDQLLISDAVTEKMQELKANSLESKLVINIQNLEDDLPIRCLRSGAAGVLAKNQNNKTILKAINCVSNGELWANRTLIAQIFKEDWGQKLIQETSENLLFSSLTAREKTIAQLATQGMNSKKMASHLNISVKTVRNQLTVIYSKLGVKNHIGLILLTRD